MKQILTLILITLGIATQAQEKVLILIKNNGDKNYLYPSTIRKSTYGITAWYERIYAKPQYDKNENKYYTYSKFQNLIDCNGMKSSLTSIINYSKNGNVIYSGKQNEYKSYLELSPKTPGSIGWHMIEEACSRYRGY